MGVLCGGLGGAAGLSGEGNMASGGRLEVDVRGWWPNLGELPPYGLLLADLYVDQWSSRSDDWVRSPSSWSSETDHKQLNIPSTETNPLQKDNMCVFKLGQRRPGPGC